jgi:hypothetical protein
MKERREPHTREQLLKDRIEKKLGLKPQPKLDWAVEKLLRDNPGMSIECAKRLLGRW